MIKYVIIAIGILLLLAMLGYGCMKGGDSDGEYGTDVTTPHDNSVVEETTQEHTLIDTGGVSLPF